MGELGEWAHGWQHYATSASEHHFRESVVLAQSCPSHQTHLRSHSGSGCSHVFCGCPTQLEFRINPDLFRVLILERLRVPLPVTEARCECGAVLDCRAACPQSGRLRTRALAPERTLARVCREAGASVRRNVKLVEMNIAVAANDERAIEVVASGLPVHHGAQLAVDITLRCALTASGLPRPGAAVADGVVARRKKGSTPSFFRVTDVVWWSLPWKQEVAGAQKQFVPPHGLEMLHRRFNGPASSLGYVGGRACSPPLAPGLLHVLWWHRPNCHTLSRASTGVCLTLQTFSARRE